MSQLSDPDKKLLDELRKELDDIKYHEEKLKQLFIKASRLENHVDVNIRSIITSFNILFKDIIKKSYIALACRESNLNAFLLERNQKRTNIANEVVNSYNNQIDYLYRMYISTNLYFYRLYSKCT